MMFKLVLERAEEPEIKLPTSAGSWFSQIHLAMLEERGRSLGRNF